MKKVTMSKKEFVSEHKNLVSVLRHGSKSERNKEAKKQSSELGVSGKHLHETDHHKRMGHQLAED